jgi:hypothetical protein
VPLHLFKRTLAHCNKQDAGCLAKRFVVFSNQIDLQGHVITEHPGAAVPRRIEVNFTVRRSNRDGSGLAQSSHPGRRRTAPVERSLRTFFVHIIHLAILYRVCDERSSERCAVMVCSLYTLVAVYHGNGGLHVCSADTRSHSFPAFHRERFHQ